MLSTTVVGSGGAWGGTVRPDSHYVLDAANGATLLTVPFGHALDAVAYVLGEPERLRIRTAARRTSAVDAESGRSVPMTAPDQVVASGRLPGGAVATFHYRGGTARATNFRWESNGTEGDLLLTAPTGHPQLAPVTLEGGRGTSTGLAPLPVPDSYVRVPHLDPRTDAPAFAVAHAYRQLLDDLREGTAGVPDFAHGAARHRSIAATAALPGDWVY
ncbi:Gfo/Idh/MocA family protein [Streptomyces sp. enrichment culture]|uniref:Gfo/Idh/MocA family protein n=1 Tax=Streptomyces sp. enrichment culture TaxID=1795815 RepID=UPI003F56442A